MRLECNCEQACSLQEFLHQAGANWYLPDNACISALFVIMIYLRYERYVNSCVRFDKFYEHLGPYVS